MDTEPELKIRRRFYAEQKKALASLGLCGREGSSSLPTGTARPENQGWGGQASLFGSGRG